MTEAPNFSSNSTAIVDREIASGSIEGVDFGPRVWVIARSPAAVLIWVYGQSQSINGFQRYYEPHLTILPDRSPAFINRPTYKSLRHEWTRLTAVRLLDFREEIISAFGADSLRWIEQAVLKRRTVVFEDGGGPLKPAGLYGHAHREWTERYGNGFVVVPEGMKRHDMYRHKLGWKPENAA